MRADGISVQTMPDARSTTSHLLLILLLLYQFFFLYHFQSLSLNFTHRHESRRNVGTDHVRRAIDQHHAPLLLLFLLSLLLNHIILSFSFFFSFHFTSLTVISAEGISVRTLPDARSTSITPFSSWTMSYTVRSCLWCDGRVCDVRWLQRTGVSVTSLMILLLRVPLILLLFVFLEGAGARRLRERCCVGCGREWYSRVGPCPFEMFSCP